MLLTYKAFIGLFYPRVCPFSTFVVRPLCTSPYRAELGCRHHRCRWINGQRKKNNHSDLNVLKRCNSLLVYSYRVPGRLQEFRSILSNVFSQCGTGSNVLRTVSMLAANFQSEALWSTFSILLQTWKSDPANRTGNIARSVEVVLPRWIRRSRDGSGVGEYPERDHL